MLRYRLLCSLHAVRAATCPAERLDDDANAYARRALFVAERHYGPAHAQTADSLYRVAASLCRRAEYPEAMQYLHRALAIQTRTHGERHPEAGRVLCALAQVYKCMCNFERAARYDRLWRLCPLLPKQPKVGLYKLNPVDP
jgi:tetratricopeptide (TPR) repeat protein